MIEALEPRTFLAAGSVLLVGSLDTDNVLRYDAGSGEFIDDFVPRRSGGVNQPWSIVIGPHDGHLYVSTGHFQGPGQMKAVLRFDGETGAFIDEFVPPGEMDMPHAVTFGPDGNLYVGDRLASGQGRIARFDGHTGEFLDDFVAPGSGGIEHPLAHVFGPDASGDGALDLYVTDEHTLEVLHYDGVTGAFLGVFVPAGAGGMSFPFPLAFGPDGNLYVGDFAGVDSGAVRRFQGPAGQEPGALMDTFIPAGSGGLLIPLSVLFGPDRNGDGAQDLYVGSAEMATSFMVAKNHTSSVKVYDGVTGEYLEDFINVGSGGLRNPGLMTFTESDPVTLAYRGGGHEAEGIGLAGEWSPQPLRADSPESDEDPEEADDELDSVLA
jgi:hypothetical protein